MEIDDRILDAVRQTEIIRPPKQTLSTFGITNIYYYLLSEPVYTEFANNINETVIREGRVIAQKPRVVTPYYLTRLEGFSADARHYFEMLLQQHGGNAPGIFYTYKNEPKEMNIVSDGIPAVVDKLNADIDRRGEYGERLVIDETMNPQCSGECQAPVGRPEEQWHSDSPHSTYLPPTGSLIFPRRKLWRRDT